MFFKLTATILVDDESQLDDIKDKILDMLSDTIAINIGMPNEERSRIAIERCFHDTNPSLPCTIIYQEEGP